MKHIIKLVNILRRIIMAGVVNAGAGLIGKDAGSQDKIDQQNARIAEKEAQATADAKILADAKKREQDIADQNKVDILRRRRGASSLLSGDGISNNATQQTLG
jgi:hypothetical protein